MLKSSIRKYLSTLLVTLLLTGNSCKNQPPNEIIQTDQRVFMPDLTNGMTVEDSEAHSRNVHYTVLENTLGRSVPDTKIFTTGGDQLNLKNIIQPKTIVISSDAHCGWGTEGITNDFPKAVSKIRSSYPEFDWNIVCLLKRDSSDFENPTKFNQLIKEVRSLYDTFYIIDEQESRKLNMFANPCRLYIGKEKIVSYMRMGTYVEVSTMYKEVLKNTLGLVPEKSSGE
jgi:hypothetical protein